MMDLKTANTVCEAIIRLVSHTTLVTVEARRVERDHLYLYKVVVFGADVAPPHKQHVWHILDLFDLARWITDNVPEVTREGTYTLQPL